ncbi:MAG: hypothetical protein ABWY06_07665 [Pseudomonas sp.]|uniref:hypothetical protein n=1 Tax=Pseudomonas sp. TaxID=306 RepID=UPI0033944C09
MNDPLERATSSAPPTLGEGCVRRYDPAALDDESGSEFAEAAALWQRLHGPPGATDERADPAAAPGSQSQAGRGID